MYEGTGSAQEIRNGIDLENNDGMVWIKGRTANQYVYSHKLYDTIRGATHFLQSNLTSADAVNNSSLTNFNSNGFSLGSDINVNNGYPENYTSWTFREAPGFFDVVTYTGNQVDGRQISHDLGVEPGMILIKRLDGTANWVTYHRSNAYYLTLNSTRGNNSYNSAQGQYFFGDGSGQTSSYFTLE